MEQQPSDSMCKVVIDANEHYAIWERDRRNPLGWRDAGKSGTRDDCLAWIVGAWADSHPSARGARPEAPEQTPASRRGDRPPRRPPTPTERKLEAVLRQVLWVDDVDPADDLFVLGMHSLLLMQFAKRVEHAFSLTLPLQEYFDRPTLADLASAIDQCATAGGIRLTP